MIDKHNITLSETHYSFIVYIFSLGRQFDEALSLMQKMKVQPSPSLMAAVVGASNMYGDVSTRKIAVKQLIELDGDDDSASYVAMARLYAYAGSWVHSWNMHNFMGGTNIRKTPGACTRAKIYLPI